MNRTDKQQIVSDLAKRFSESPNVYVTDFTGITVKGMTELRKRFRAQGAEFLVVKNTLATRALEEASIKGLTEVLAGPTGLVFAGADPVNAAKVLADFQKEEEDKPTVRAGLVEGESVGPDTVKRLASIPPRDVLMAQLAGAMQGPMAGLVGAMDGLLYQFVGSVEALRAQRAEAA